jgi:DNA-binding transcriptional MerR regulator
MKIGDLAKRTGTSVHTIRYYERIGLLPRAHRDPSRHRDYDIAILDWLGFIFRLKTTGMPIRQMLRYAALRDRGAETQGERQRLLEEHRAHVAAHIAELQAGLIVLDTKIAGYAGATKGNETDDAERPESDSAASAGKPPRARAAQAR